MINIDVFITVLMTVTLVNLVRALTSLRTMIYVMREAHPLLYQQVDGGGFFTSHPNITKQVRLFSYLKEKEYLHHHEPVFIEKCQKVRDLFTLTFLLTLLTLALSWLG